MKRLIAFALSAVMALSLAACSNTSTPKDNSVEIPNPFTECETLEDAAEIAGFSVTVPNAIDGYDQRLIQAYPGDKGVAMVEVIYRNGDEDTSNELRIRKAAGNKDISGDYNDYANSNTATIGANEVTMRGNDDLVSVVTWINGDYAYSIYSNSGLSKVTATDLVNAVDSGSSDSGMVGGDPATWGPELDSDASSGVQLPNPFTECKTLEEAAKIVGFSLTAPESIDGYAQRIIQAYPGDEGVAMMEVIFENGEENTRNEIRIRKAAGSDDISGDYTQYTESTTVTVGELEVTMKGADGQINLATWASNGYTYSIGAYSESGISSDVMTNLVAAVQ